MTLADQLPQDLWWIRSPFLDDDTDHGTIVVHGHTISKDIEIRDNRIGLDTGAYSTGVLSAIGIESDERWFIRTDAAPAPEITAGRVANYSDA